MAECATQSASTLRATFADTARFSQRFRARIHAHSQSNHRPSDWSVTALPPELQADACVSVSWDFIVDFTGFCLFFQPV